MAGYQVHVLFKNGDSDYENFSDEASAKKYVKQAKARGAKSADILLFKGAAPFKRPRQMGESAADAKVWATVARKRAGLIKAATVSLKASRQYQTLMTKAIEGDIEAQATIRELAEGGDFAEATYTKTVIPEITKFKGLDQKAKDDSDEDEDAKDEEDEDAKDDEDENEDEDAKDDENEDEDEDEEEDSKSRTRGRSKAAWDSSGALGNPNTPGAAADFVDRVTGGGDRGMAGRTRMNYVAGGDPSPRTMPDVTPSPFGTGGDTGPDAFGSNAALPQVEAVYQKWLVNSADGIHAGREIGLTQQDLEAMHVRRTAVAQKMDYWTQSTNVASDSGTVSSFDGVTRRVNDQQKAANAAAWRKKYGSR